MKKKMIHIAIKDQNGIKAIKNIEAKEKDGKIIAHGQSKMSEVLVIVE